MKVETKTVLLLEDFAEIIEKHCHSVVTDPQMLVEHLETFADAVNAIKNFRKECNFSALEPLEKEFVSVLGRFARHQESGDEELLRNLIRQDLSENIQRWRVEGIPEIFSALEPADHVPTPKEQE